MPWLSLVGVFKMVKQLIKETAMNINNAFHPQHFQPNITGKDNHQQNAQQIGDNNTVNFVVNETSQPHTPSPIEKLDAVEKVKTQLTTLPRAMKNLQRPNLLNKKETWNYVLRLLYTTIKEHARGFSEPTQQQLASFFSSLQAISATQEVMQAELPKVERKVTELLELLEAEKS